MKTLVTTLVVVTALSGWTHPLFAQDNYERVLRISPGLCPETVQSMVNWASRANSIGAFAMPVDNTTGGEPCDLRHATGVTAASQTTEAGAADSARAQCNANLPKNFAPCQVIGILIFRPAY